MSISGQIVSEIVAQLCLENSIQTLLIFFGSTLLIYSYICRKKKQKKSQPVYAFSVGLLDVGEVFDSPVSRLPTISGGGGFPCNQNNTLIEKRVVNTKWQNITPFTRKK